MILTYKVITNQVKIDPNEVFKRANRTMRGHHLKLQKKKATRMTSINAFSNRIVNDWNILPSHVVSTNSTNEFKNAIDDHWVNEMFQTPF